MMVRRSAPALACSLILCTHAALGSSPAAAIVGGAANANEALARHVVMLVGPRGFCSGVAIARSVVLTAAHCVLAGADTKLAEFDAARQPVLKDIATIARHPGFDADAALRQRVTADVALLKLAEPLASRFVPAPLAAPRRPVAVGDLLLVAGYGLAAPGDGRSGCAPRGLRSPANPGRCRSAWSIPPPRAIGRDSAPAREIPARRCSRTVAGSSASSAW